MARWASVFKLSNVSATNGGKPRERPARSDRCLARDPIRPAHCRPDTTTVKAPLLSLGSSSLTPQHEPTRRGHRQRLRLRADAERRAVPDASDQAPGATPEGTGTGRRQSRKCSFWDKFVAFRAGYSRKFACSLAILGVAAGMRLAIRAA